MITGFFASRSKRFVFERSAAQTNKTRLDLIFLCAYVIQLFFPMFLLPFQLNYFLNLNWRKCSGLAGHLGLLKSAGVCRALVFLMCNINYPPLAQLFGKADHLMPAKSARL